MKQHWKRIVTTTFAVLLFALWGVAQAEGLPSQTFDFKQNQVGSVKDATIAANGWRIVPEATSAYTQSITTGLRYQVYGIQAQVRYANQPIESDTVLELKINTAGNYKVQYSGGLYGGGAIVQVFLDGSYLGVYDHYSDQSTVQGDIVTLGTLNLTAGLHRVTFRSIGKVSKSSGLSQYIGCLSFVGVQSLPKESGSTIYTAEKVAAARENVVKYDWAREQMIGVIEKCKPYLGMTEKLWELIPQEGLPRGITVGYQGELGAYTCPYCGVDLRATYGTYPWISDPLNDPWKIKCPACSRRFPSNDFEKFYKSGIDEKGVFHLDLAKKNGQAYLTNELYPEKGAGWGVDDGFGYVMPDGQHKTFIGYYIHWGLWYPNGSVNPGLFFNALKDLRDAYLMTGDARYGRVGAILIDRIADVYPAYDLSPYFGTFYNSHGGGGEGKIIGRIWETELATTFVDAYDTFRGVYDDPEVVSFLSGKAADYGLANAKTTPELIRQNCEDGILRTIFGACKKAQIFGNFGMHQETLVRAAVALNSPTETKTMIDWAMQPGTYQVGSNTGGNILVQLVNNVNRDGTGNEAAPGYNTLWVDKMLGLAEVLHDYKAYQTADLYLNPKFTKMFASIAQMTLVSKYTVQIGDSGATGSTGIVQKLPSTLIGFMRVKSPLLAQTLYMLNGDTVSGLHYDVYTKDPESVQQDVSKIINERGTLRLASDNLAGLGFAVLRDGDANPDGTGDTQRDFWMDYGRNSSHGHPAALNIGLDAYGFNLSPDLGYPEATGGDLNRAQWINNTLSHNTVVVNARKQDLQYESADIHHFDDSGRVKLMDASSPESYPETSIYRRTVVMVQATDDVSYGVDFFRVKGGDDHLYSFHPQSNEVFQTENLNLTAQAGGTYAGVSIPWGIDTTGAPLGFTWLEDVRRDAAPKGAYAVDYKINDPRGLMKDQRNLHLRLTMLNRDLTDVALAKGTPPRVKNNSMVGKLEYLLARRQGTNLDTLFTSVFEPYDGARYLSEIEDLTMSTPANARMSGKRDCDIVYAKSGSAGADDAMRAVKVTFQDGREDYVLYATNGTVTYAVAHMDASGNDTELFTFKGFVGVLTMVNGVRTYSYLNDGSELSGMTATPAYTGTVLDFTRTISMENSITISTPTTIDPSTIVGRYIYVDNSIESGAYRILGARALSGTSMLLDIGDVTPIWRYKDANDPTQGFQYNMTKGQTWRIPLSKTSSGTITLPSNAIQTVNGAQVRTTGAQGLRFVSRIQKSVLSDLAGAGATDVEYGTLLIPSTDLASIDELVLGAVLNGHSVAQVPAKAHYLEDTQTISFTAVLTNVAEANYQRGYTARAYLRYTLDGQEHVVYADAGADRNIYYVAKSALPNATGATKTALQTVMDQVGVQLSYANGVVTVENSNAFYTATVQDGKITVTALGGYLFTANTKVSVNGVVAEGVTLGTDGKTLEVNV